MFRTEYGVETTGEDNSWDGDLPGSPDEIKQLLRGLEHRWRKVRGLAITDRIVMGNFSYTNMPMVADLENNLEAFAANDFVAAIAGVAEAWQSLLARIQEPSINRPDTDPPENEFLVVDADASQNRAINRVLAGESLVIWGPPGTGKSQTIANLIAALIAQDKRVLFVAEKRAAIEVVVARLRQVGLSNLVMDVHGGVKSKREFANSLADTMRDVSTIPARDDSALHRQLSERRSDLIAHVNAMHTCREPWQVSPFKVQAKLMGATESAATSVAMPADKARKLNRKTVDALMEDAREWVYLDGPGLSAQYPEWARSSINSSGAAQQAFELVRDSAAQFPDVRRRLFSSLDEVGLAYPDSVADWSALLRWLSEIARLQQRFTPEVYGLDHDDLLDTLDPVNRWWWPVVARLPTRYRAARKSVLATRRNAASLSDREARQAVAYAGRQVRKWRALAGAGDYPRAPASLSDVSIALDRLTELLQQAGSIF